MAVVANPPIEARLLLHALAKNWWPTRAITRRIGIAIAPA